MRKQGSPYHVHHSSHHNSGGFSIIELVFAMSFLTIIILGVVSLQTSNLVMMSGQQNQIQAQFLANQGLQITKSIGYAGIDSKFMGGGCDPLNCVQYLNLTGGSYNLDGASEDVIRGNQTFSRKIQILAGPTKSNNSIETLSNGYKIKAIIEWEDATGPHIQAEGSQVESSLIVFN